MSDPEQQDEFNEFKEQIQEGSPTELIQHKQKSDLYEDVSLQERKTPVRVPGKALEQTASNIEDTSIVKNYGNDDVPIGDEYPSDDHINKSPPKKKVIKKPLKEETSTVDEQPKVANYGNDEIPIGKKGNFQIDEFPTEDQEVKKKVPPKKAAKKPALKEEECRIIEEEPLQYQQLANYGNDDVPIGGKSTFQIDEFPPEGQEVKKKAPPKKAAKKPMVQNFDDAPKVVESLDEKPVGAGAKFTISEYLDNEAPPEESKDGSTQLPIQSRIKSKVWKQRQSAFEEMYTMFEQAQKNDPCFSDFYEEWAKFLNDSNPGSQEKALMAFRAFIQKCNIKELSNRNDFNEILKVIIDKCISPGKPQIKKVAVEVVCDLFERKEKNEMLEALKGLLGNKTLKIVAATINTIIDLLTNFGPKPLDFLKAFFGEIEKLLGQNASQVRNECMQFYKEAYKWLGKGLLDNYTKNLKKAQLEELEKFYNEWGSQAMVPLRGGASFDPNANGGNASGGAGVDAYDIVDAVDILAKYNEKWYDKVLALTKWNEKVQQLDEFIKAANIPKITPPQNFAILLSFFKKLLNEANVNVNTSAVKLIGNLQKGMRKNFYGASKILFPLLMFKLREKKNQLVDETRQTLETFFYSLGIEDVIEDFKEGIADKTSQLKVQLLKFLQVNQENRFQLLGKQKDWKIKNQQTLVQILPILKKLLEDSDRDVRDAALQCLGKIKIHLPESSLSQLNDIGQAKMQKINEIAGTMDKSPPLQDKQNNLVQSQVSQTQNLKESQVIQNQSAVKTKNFQKQEVGKQQQQLGKIEDEQEPTPEEAENILRQKGIPDDFFTSMDGSPKEKSQALQSLQDADILPTCFDSLLFYLKKKTKEFKDGNLVVNKELFALFNFARQLKDPRILRKRSFPPMCRFLFERMGEVKFKDDISQMLDAACSSVPPNYVIMQLLLLAKPPEKKNEKPIVVPPKTVAEIYSHMSRIIDLVSMKYVPLKEVLEFAREGVAQTNPTMKQPAMELIKTLYKHIGKDLTNFLQDIPPQQLKILQSEFEKVQEIPINQRGQPQIQFLGEAAQESKVTVSSSNPLDQLPRADISGEIPKVIKKLQDQQWQKKKEGIEDLDKILNQNNNNVSTNGMKDLIEIIKQNLTDKSKTIIRNVVTIAGRLAEACGKDFKNYGKIFIIPLLGILSDKQAPLRQDTIQALEKVSIAIGHENVVGAMPASLSLESPELKQELLSFILKYPEGLQKQDIKFFVSPLLNCLCDRVKEVRSLSEQVIEKAIQCGGVEPFMLAVKDLKPAVIQQIKPTLIKFGADFDDGERKRNNKTPKGKKEENQLMLTQPPLPKDQKKLTRNGTHKDLNGSFENDKLQGTPTKIQNQKSNFEHGCGTPKAVHQQIQNIDIKQMQQQIKGVFLEGSLIAQSVSVRELKQSRMNNHERHLQWMQEVFSESNVNEVITDMKICFKENIFQQLMSYDYRQIILVLKSLSQFLQETMQKNNCIEVSDLILKWILIRIYGGNSNELVIRQINQFLSSFFVALDKNRYQFNELEIVLSSKVIRELIYQGIIPDDKIMNCFIRMSSSEKAVQQWIILLKTDPTQIHQFLQGEQVIAIIQDNLFKLFHQYLINYRSNETLYELAKLPQLNQYSELIQEIQRTYGDDAVKKAGIIPDPMSMAPKLNANPQQISLIQIQTPTQMQQRQEQNQYMTGQNSPRSVQFKQCLQSLLSPQVATKIESLMQINDIISKCENIQGNQSTYPLYLLVNNAPVICQCFHSLMNWSFLSGETVPPQYRQFLLAALQKLYQIQPYVKALEYDPLCQFTEDLMLRLLSEDEHKSQIDLGDQVVKQLNSTTLRILENTEPDLIYSILLDLLIKYRRKQQQQQNFQPQSKVLNLLMKCIIRVSRFLEKQIQSLQVNILIWKFHLYMSEFSQQPNFPPDDIGMKIIKTILAELVKLLGENIWTAYQVVNQSELPDQHLQQWIKLLAVQQPQIKNNQQNSVSQVISPRDQRRLQSAQVGAQYQQPQRTSLDNSGLDLQMRRIGEMLKRPDMQEEGVRQIVDLVKKNPSLKWQPYVQDSNKSLINYIQQQLGQQQQITQVQNLNSTPPPQQRKSMMPSYQQQNQIDPSSNIAELDSRINLIRANMKQGYGSEISQNLINNNSSLTQSQINQQIKTPDFLMQRLNDMKTRVQTLVGPTKNNIGGGNSFQPQ